MALEVVNIECMALIMSIFFFNREERCSKLALSAEGFCTWHHPICETVIGMSKGRYWEKGEDLGKRKNMSWVAVGKEGGVEGERLDVFCKRRAGDNNIK